MTTLQPGQTCTIAILFTPTTLASDAAHLDIADDEPSSPINVKLTGIGTYVQITPRTINFGSSGLDNAQTATITNTGTSDVVLTNILIGMAPQYKYFRLRRRPAPKAWLLAQAAR